MNVIKKDILSDIDKSKQTVILHGCNCFHTMGSGIALYLKQKYPSIVLADLKTKKGDFNKLGSVSKAFVDTNLIILNLYTQYNYGRGKHVNYSAVSECLRKVAIYTYSLKNVEVRSPKIGCGLAGGDWNIVEPLFEQYLPKCTIYSL